MNWDSLKFDWNKARAFLVTAEEGSFSAAARALGMSQPTLGRQVSSLEEELGVILIERVNQGIHVTPLGLELLLHLKDMGEAASRFSMSASGQKSEIEGKVRISCTDTMAAYILPNLIRLFHKEEPKIVIEIISSYGITDILRRECDIAIRHSEPEEDDLVARKLPDQLFKLYCSKDIEKSLSDTLEGELIPFVGVVGSNDQIIAELNRLGVLITEENFKCYAGNHVEHWNLVRAGMGVGIMAESIAKQCSDVVEYPKLSAPICVPTWLVTHRERANNLRLKRVYDYIAESLIQILKP
ncbi:LysR family transcriptional regulator [Vibrio sp. DW001]|uniref:LysR family transcriptional regulator n=1 Tax=Vibrio sp. DW001 TaxID=2912315 RepID=UPI0023B1B9CF|nr:LysR family transcriptional regulator [Vibrio sp. DW001]WED25662.1 LysR family transcriptional regulator [Vibrio sp. DW001]